MSQRDVEILRCAFKAFQQGEMRAALETLDSEIEIHPPAEDPDMDPVFHGHQGALSYLLRWLEPWEEFQFDVDEFVDAGDKVVVMYSQHGRGKSSGVELSNQLAAVIEMRDGKAVRADVYLDRDEALRAAGARG